VDGIYGHLTEQAVLAFQGVEGIARDGIYGPNTAARMSSATRPQPKSIRGDLIEIDERSQVLLVVRDGRVLWAFHTSTGTEGSYSHPNGETYLADTPNGKWTITWQVDGWRDGRLGRMWRPKYFHRDGIAIHGFPSVPAYPASHGCARVSIRAMNHIWTTDLVPKGSAVWVY
jgi:lipoprotein-anchoring transpeptidase ErfK/SrfK